MEPGIAATCSVYNHTFCGLIDRHITKRKYQKGVVPAPILPTKLNQTLTISLEQPVRNDQWCFENFDIVGHQHYHLSWNIKIPDLKEIGLSKKTLINKRIGGQ